jgi:hypothetical protein
LTTIFIRTGGRTGRGSSACCFLLIFSSTAFFARPVRGPANGSADLGVPPVYGVHERTYMLLQAPSSAFLPFRPPSRLALPSMLTLPFTASSPATRSPRTTSSRTTTRSRTVLLRLLMRPVRPGRALRRAFLLLLPHLSFIPSPSRLRLPPSPLPPSLSPPSLSRS